MTKRKRHTLSEKVAIARKAEPPLNSISATAHAEDLPESTGLAGLESTMAEQENMSNLKHARSDRMPMLTKGLQALCKTACGLIPPIALMLETITVKGAEISKLLPAEKENGKDIVMVEEESAVKNLIFSKTWGM